MKEDKIINEKNLKLIQNELNEMKGKSGNILMIWFGGK